LARRTAGEVRILVQSSPLAGFKYHAGEDLWHELREGDRLIWCARPTTNTTPTRSASNGAARNWATCRARKTGRGGGDG
jgi:hypothetical protein